MPRKEYNKLVRDRIPEIIQADGRACEVIEMDTDEYCLALRQKLVEEANEVLNADTGELLKEMADVYEVLEALAATYDLDEAIIREKQQQRKEDRGGFTKRLKLIWGEVD